MLRVLPAHRHATGEKDFHRGSQHCPPLLDRAERAASVGSVRLVLITKSLIEEKKKLHTAEKVSQEENSPAVSKPCPELLSNCPEPVVSL